MGIHSKTSFNTYIMRFVKVALLFLFFIVIKSQFAPDTHPLRYRKRAERCFRRAGAMNRYYIDQKAVDITKMVKCLRKVEKVKEKHGSAVKEKHEFNLMKFL